MKAAQSRPIGTDPDGHRGTVNALVGAFGMAANPLLIDAAADADFENMIERLRGEPGSSKGGKQ